MITRQQIDLLFIVILVFLCIDSLIDKRGMFSASKISSIIIHETISNYISQLVSALWFVTLGGHISLYSLLISKACLN